MPDKAQKTRVPSNGSAGASAEALYRREVYSFPLLNRKERETLIREIVDPEKREKFITSNLRLVLRVAELYYRYSKGKLYGVGLMDLVQAGNMGLLEAIKRFDPERGFQFSTYAIYWIKEQIRKTMSDEGRVIRIPSHQRQRIREFHKTRRCLSRELRRKPDLGEIADRMRLSLDKICDIQDDLQAAAIVSLEALLEPQNKEEQTRTYDPAAIVDRDNLDPLRFLIIREEVESRNREREECFKRVQTSSLKPREKAIYCLRFGLNGDSKPKTLKEIATEVGLSYEGVRQVLIRALVVLGEGVPRHSRGRSLPHAIRIKQKKKAG